MNLVAYYTLPYLSRNREIVVQFNADVADGMQWKFTPTQREVYTLYAKKGFVTCQCVF